MFFSSDVANPDTYTALRRHAGVHDDDAAGRPRAVLNQYTSAGVSAKANNWQDATCPLAQREYDRIFTESQGELAVKRAALFIRMNDLVVSSNHIIPLVMRPTVSASLNALHPVLSAWDGTTWLLSDWWRDLIGLTCSSIWPAA